MALAVVGAVALWFGLAHFPRSEDDDDDPVVLVALAMFTNFGGWIVGLALGAAAVRLRRGRPA